MEDVMHSARFASERAVARPAVVRDEVSVAQKRRVDTPYAKLGVHANRRAGKTEPMTEPNPTAGSAQDDLFADVYARLKAMAARQLSRAPPRGTLDTTGLVHELYLRMYATRQPGFEHRAQFFAYAARAMRHLLADRARDRLRQRAGGDWQRVTLTGSDQQLAIDSAEQARALDGALQRLERTDERAARVLELHYFAGLTAAQIAETLDVARSTVDRDWRFARAFLAAEVGE
jgi:RNA polymerase sigma factor (TIGR02999 family)